eukprot:1455267-Rhodomonas_salina.1
MEAGTDEGDVRSAPRPCRLYWRRSRTLRSSRCALGPYYMLLRACCAMPGTDLRDAPGTELRRVRYCPTRCPVLTYGVATLQRGPSREEIDQVCMPLRAGYAMSGTDRAYRPTRCLVLP